MTNAPFETIGDFRDIESLNHYREAVAHGGEPAAVLAAMRPVSRDNARTPMQWDDSAHAGFTTGTPWIPLNPNYKEINAAAAVADQDSVFHYYRRLIELRHTEPVVAHGDFTMLLPVDPKVYAFTRTLDDVTLLVLGNFSASAVSVDVPDPQAWARAELVLSNYPAALVDAGLPELRPWEARVYRRRA
jgi:oligo-1,6-glucosidase